jgi:hypothetical protein
MLAHIRPRVAQPRPSSARGPATADQRLGGCHHQAVRRATPLLPHPPPLRPKPPPPRGEPRHAPLTPSRAHLGRRPRPRRQRAAEPPRRPAPPRVHPRARADELAEQERGGGAAPPPLRREARTVVQPQEALEPAAGVAHGRGDVAPRERLAAEVVRRVGRVLQAEHEAEPLAARRLAERRERPCAIAVGAAPVGRRRPTVVDARRRQRDGLGARVERRVEPQEVHEILSEVAAGAQQQAGGDHVDERVRRQPAVEHVGEATNLEHRPQHAVERVERLELVPEAHDRSRRPVARVGRHDLHRDARPVVPHVEQRVPRAAAGDVGEARLAAELGEAAPDDVEEADHLGLGVPRRGIYAVGRAVQIAADVDVGVRREYAALGGAEKTPAQLLASVGFERFENLISYHVSGDILQLGWRDVAMKSENVPGQPASVSKRNAQATKRTAHIRRPSSPRRLR